MNIIACESFALPPTYVPNFKTWIILYQTDSWLLDGMTDAQLRTNASDISETDLRSQIGEATAAMTAFAISPKDENLRAKIARWKAMEESTVCFEIF